MISVGGNARKVSLCAHNPVIFSEKKQKMERVRRTLSVFVMKDRRRKTGRSRTRRMRLSKFQKLGKSGWRETLRFLSFPAFPPKA